jgi:Domain of unknown function (DUF1963)
MEQPSDRVKACLERASGIAASAAMFDAIRELHRDAPRQLAPLLLELLVRATRSATYLDAGLSLVSEEELAEIAERAVDLLSASAKHEAAAHCVTRAALQVPLALRPHLRVLYGLRATERASTMWWRGAGPDEVVFLRDVVAGARQDRASREFAWRCLLEAGSDTAVHHALEHVPPSLPHPVSMYLEEVGFEQTGSTVSRLVADACFHIRFSGPYLAALEAPKWWPTHIEPSWTLAVDEGPRCTVGGIGSGICAACDQPLHGLVSISTLPDGLGVRSVERLALVTCLSCLGWEMPTMFFRHHADGTAQPLYDGAKRTPEFPVGPLRETHAHLVRTPARWRRQEWGASNGRENLHRVGGHPTWVQSAQYPTCPDCKTTMPFLLQLDSNLPCEDGREWMWGSGGLGYFFWCDRCAISAGHWQCT